MKRVRKNLEHDQVLELIPKILLSGFWLPTIHPMTCYARIHDDTDGKEAGIIRVVFSSDGDAHIWIDQSSALRFRMPGIGGGLSPRVRVALLILAEAIRLDNDDNPDLSR
jgi:hypothetical protein